MFRFFKYFFLPTFFLFTASINTALVAEGTKQLQPNPGFISNLRVNGGNSTNTGNNAGFLANANEALYIHIQNFSQERIYFGFAAYLPGNFYVRVKDPTGAIVYGPVLIPSVSAPGFINSYNEAFNGPVQLQAGGYNALSYNPTQNGDYTIEFNSGSPSIANTTVLDLKYYDITVANTISMTAIPGRLYAYMWGMSTDSYSIPTEATYYAYTEDQVVTTLSLNGITPFAYGVYCNRTGVYNTGNVVTDRRSRQWRQSPLPQYKLFLNDPDPIDYPSGVFPTLTKATKISGCAATGYCIELAIDKIADAEIFLDLNGNGVYNAGTVDVLLNRKVNAGVNCIPWDGKNGLGATVAAGTQITGYVKAIAGLTNFPIFDAENNYLGIKAGIVRPASPAPLIFWDDSNLGGTTNLTGASSPSHAWGADFGNERMMNTWWYTYVINTSFLYTISPQCPPIAMPDPVEACTNTALTFNPLLNDTDSESNISPGSISILLNPLHGTATANADGSITYVPAPGYSGLDTLTYQVCDATGMCSNQTGEYGKVYINVGATFDLAATNVCNGGATGTISFATNSVNLTYGFSSGNTYTGANPPGTTTVKGINTINGLSQGAHTVRLHNGACFVDKTITIVNNPNPALTLSYLPFCPGGTTKVSFPTGNTNYRYDYSAGVAYTGANPPVSYISVNGNNAINSLPAGTYTVRLYENATKCFTDQSITPAAGGSANPAFAGLAVANTCGNSLGSISFTSTAGFRYDYTNGIYYTGATPPTAYTVAPGANVIPNLNSGTYTVRLKNNTTDCYKDTSVNVSSNNPLLDISKTDICGGTGTGTLTFPTTTTTLRYDYSTGATYIGAVPPATATIVGKNNIGSLAANTYTVRLHNPGNGCFTNRTVSIGSSPNPSFTMSKTDVCGAGLGNISFTTATTGLKYDYSTSGSYTGEVPPDSNTTVSGNNFITGLTANTYTVRVRNPNTGCYLDQSIAIVANPNPTLVLSMNGATCNDGAVSFNTAVAGFKYDYNQGGVFSKSPPPTAFTTINGTNIIGSLPAAFYTVRLHNAATGCFTDQTIQVTKTSNCPPVAVNNSGNTNEDVSVVLPVIVNNDSDSDGILDVSTIDLDPTLAGVQTTYTNFTGTWSVSSGGNVVYTPQINFTGTATIPYTVKDDGSATSNQANLSVTVNAVNDAPVAVNNNTSTPEGYPVTFNIATNDTDVDGTIDPTTIDLDPTTAGDQKTITTAQGTFTVNAAGVLVFTPVGGFTGTATATYTIKDNSGAMSNVATITMTVIPAPTATPVVSNVSCNGGSSGSVTITSPSGGVAPYVYSFNGSAYTATTVYTNLIAGSYTLSMRDANMTIVSLGTQTITQPAVQSATVSKINVTCNGASTGSVSISAPTGGVAPYSYSFNGSAYSTTTSYPGLAAGTYTVSMRDANMCVVALPNQLVTQPAVQSATVSKIDVACNGASTGSVSITSPAGGAAPYSYSFNGSAYSTTTSYPGLAAGTYTVSMRDANMCVVALPNQAVTQPAVQSATVSKIDVVCNGASTGSVTFSSPTGGVAPYSYSFNGLAYSTTTSYSGLAAGTYTVSMRDANMCVVALPNQAVTQPAIQSATVSKINVTCNGASTGSVSITSPTGGAAPYSYSFNGSAYSTTTSYPGLAAGTYTVSMRDVNMCVVALPSQAVTQPAVQSATVASTAATCSGNNGSISITLPAGGTAPYQYSLNGAAYGVSSSFINLASGTYSVNMRDASLCVIALPTQVVTQPAGLTAASSAIDVTCHGGSNGSLNITSSSGGVSPYEYSFNGAPFTTATTLSGLAAGNYPISMRDANGCVYTLVPQAINEPASLSATAVATAIACNGGSNGSITISAAAGGVAPYTYELNASGYSATTSYSGLTSGLYTLSMRDANMCVMGLPNQTISQPTLQTATLTASAATCNGASNGSVTISSPTGGVAPYAYSFNGSGYSTVTSLNGLAAGTYNVSMRDANMCVVALPSQAVTQPAVQSATVSKINVTCNGASTGSVSISAPTGGVAPYSYSFNGSAYSTTTSYPGLAAGTYTVSMRDANMCVVALPNQLVTQPAVQSATVSKIDVACNGASTGSVSISAPTGGAAPYSYSFNGSAYSPTTSYPGLAAGTYTVSMRDANMCVVALPNQAVTQPAVQSATVSKINVTCNGASTGSVSISAPTGGAAPYSYSFNGSAYSTTASYPGLAAGTYTVSMRDANMCVVALPNQVVTEPAIQSATVSKIDVACNGASTGSVSITAPTGGAAPYSYSFNGSAYSTTTSYPGLATGTYAVSMRDANMCVVALPSQTIVQPAILNAAVNNTSASCSGNDGTISITSPSGGFAPFEFSINGAPYTSSLLYPNLSAGSYTVAMRDANACVVALPTQNIAQPSGLMATAAATSVSCFGGNNGSVNITSSSGGVAPYTYSFNGGAYGSATSINGLSAGTYSISLKDGSGCIFTLSSQVVSEPAQLTATVTMTPITCYGAGNGSLAIASPLGGIAPYSYSLNSSTYASANAFTGLAAGTYLINIQDANLCTVALPDQNISEPAMLTAAVTSTPVACYGDTTGSITISSPSGGMVPYMYSLNGLAYTTSTSFTGLAAGTFTFSMKDANSCIVALPSQTVSQPPIQTAIVNSTSITCNGLNNGLIAISAPAGGVAPHRYSINGAVHSSTSSYSGLMPGTFTISIQDANGCIVPLVSQILTEPPVLSALSAVVNVTCFGGNNGSIHIFNSNGGMMPYMYSINGSTFDTVTTFKGLGAGSYTVRMQDANGCELLLPQQIITQPELIVASINNIPVTCNGAAEGTIGIFDIKGGSKPYLFSLNGRTYQPDSTYKFLVKGGYTVQIKDAANCIVALPAQSITELSVLDAVVSSIDVSGCNGNINGIVNVTNPTGGSGKYKYSIDEGNSWPGSGNTFAFKNLPLGSYYLSIQDSLHPLCVVKLASPAIILQPDSIKADFRITDVTACAGNTNGAIAIENARGGSGAYEYSITSGALWDGYGINYTYDSLGAGTYDLRIRDKNDSTCWYSLYQNLEIDEPLVISAVTKIDSVTECSGNSNGAIVITNVVGGTGVYEYSKNGGANWTDATSLGFSFTSLFSGSYEVLARDANYKACVVVLKSPAIVAQLDPLTAQLSSNSITMCYGNTNGNITVTNTLGGSGKYQFSIDGEQTWPGHGNSFTFPNLKAGNYVVSVRDSTYKNCKRIINPALSLSEPVKLSTTLDSSAITGCNGNSNGIISLTNTMGGSGNYEYSIDNGASWLKDGNRHIYTNLITGNYSVVLRDADFPLCSLEVAKSLKLPEPAMLLAQAVKTDVKECFGSQNGTISLTGAAGGSGNYEFSINGGVTWSLTQVFNKLTAGSYQVQMRDAQFQTCIKDITQSIQIIEPAKLSAILNLNNVSGCQGANNGSINITNISGGSGRYEYSIKPGEWHTTNDFPGLSPDTFEVQMRDADFSNCVMQLAPNAIIKHPNPDMAPIITNQPRDQGPICEKLSDALFSIAASGTDLKYSWSENGNLLDDNNDKFSGQNTSNLVVKTPAVSTSGSIFVASVANKCGIVFSNPIKIILDSASFAGTVTGSGEFCEGSAGYTVNSIQNSGRVIGWQKMEEGATQWQNIDSAMGTLHPGILHTSSQFRPIIKSGTCPIAFGMPVAQRAVKKPSAAVAGDDQELCGTTVDLYGNSPTAGQGRWIIYLGPNGIIRDENQSTSSFTGEAKNNYKLIWKIENGICPSTQDTVNIRLKTPVAANVSENVVISAGSTVQLNASGGAEYVWQNIGDSTLNSYTISTPVARPRKTTIYSVTVSNAEGCMDTASVMVGIEGVLVPNVFSPNEDNEHDVWKIDNILVYPKAVVEIYNRWGQQVGSLSGAELFSGWDGKCNGRELPVATYFYILKLSDDALPTNGSISILR